MVKTRQEIYKELYDTKYHEYLQSLELWKKDNSDTLDASRQANLYAIRNTDKEFYKQNKPKRYIVNVEFNTNSIESADITIFAKNKKEAAEKASLYAKQNYTSLILIPDDYSFESTVRENIYDFDVKEIK